MKTRLLTTLILAAGLFLALMHNPAYANGITVTTANDNTTDDELCTLREAIIAANTDTAYNGCTTGSAGADTITFAGNYTITLTSALTDITAPLTMGV
jgi:CSLREA domain-containing protein